MDVIKNNADGREVWRYPAERILSQTPHEIVIEAFFNRDDLDLGYTTFKRGDRFVEHFYSDRYYNIFAIYDRDNQRLKGWYCNICRPADWSSGDLLCDDLALDLWADPDGAHLVMDEDEFEALALPAAEKAVALAGLHDLIKLATQQKLPQAF